MRTIGLIAVSGLALGACSLPDVGQVRGVDLTVFQPRSTAALSQTIEKPATPQDMIDAEGRCVGGGPTADVAAGTPGGEQTAGLQTLGAGVALNMTECEVVHRLGRPERVELGQNDRNDRTAALTYTRGAWPGVYRFTAGRMTVMERAPTAAQPRRR